jgi:alcohol dehydrogenase class IV
MSTDISNLRKFVSPEIIFGAGARKTVANYAHTFGARKVLLVSDPGVAKAGWLSDIENHLAEEDIDYVTYTNVSPNPRASEIMQGADLYREQGCNVIVAEGGGSPMDCAKGIGIIHANGGRSSTMKASTPYTSPSRRSSSYPQPREPPQTSHSSSSSPTPKNESNSPSSAKPWCPTSHSSTPKQR